MNKFLILTVFTMMSLTAGFSQTEEEQVTAIRSWFAETNSNLANYIVEEKEVLEESTEGGNLKAYYKEKDLVLLHCEIFGEMGNIKEDYYYHEGKLYFVFAVKTDYSSNVYEEAEITTTVEENRYYFNNDKMIRWLNKDKAKVDKESQSFKTMEQFVFDESKRMIEVFNSH